jgi:hypothetical protein
MTKKGLTEYLLDELQKHEGSWLKKVELYIVADVQGYSPESCGRALRELAKEEKISVAYYDGLYAKHLAKYAINPPKEKKRTIEIINNVAYEKYV